MNNYDDKSRRPPLPWAETCLVFLLLAAVADGPPPGVNEAHYLTKARHYWIPSFCEGDLFLESADAHLVFYWTFGWIAAWTPLATAAWIGRICSWLLLAVGWQRLSAALIPQRWLSVLGAALFVMLQRHTQMAGEWIVGGVEAKTFAYGFVLLSLAWIVEGRWARAWVGLGAATAVHALVGGWSLVAAVIVFLRDPSRVVWNDMAAGAAIGVCLALAGVLPALALNRGVEPAVAAEAAEIYVYRRLPHHLAFHRFRPDGMIRMGMGLIAWVVVWHFSKAIGPLPLRRLQRFVGAAVAIAAAGVALDLTLAAQPQLAASLLRYYWYRLADVAVALGLTLSVLWLLRHWSNVSMRNVALGMAWMVAATWASQAAVQCWRTPMPGAFLQLRKFVDRDQLAGQFEEWRQICSWIKRNTPADARILAARGQQTIKWYAERGEVSNWKDVPQNAEDVVTWWSRQQIIYPRRVRRNGLTAFSDEELAGLMELYGATHLLVDRAKSQRTLGGEQFVRLYPPEPAAGLAEAPRTFELYRLLPAPRRPTGSDDFGA